MGCRITGRTGRPHHHREIGEALGAPKGRKLLGDTVPLSKLLTEYLLFTLGGFCIAYSSLLVVCSVFVYFPLFFVVTFFRRGYFL